MKIRARRWPPPAGFDPYDSEEESKPPAKGASPPPPPQKSAAVSEDAATAAAIAKGDSEALRQALEKRGEDKPLGEAEMLAIAQAMLGGSDLDDEKSSGVPPLVR